MRRYVLGIEPCWTNVRDLMSLLVNPVNKVAPVGRNMGALMCQSDVHQVAAFIHECLMALMVGVDPVAQRFND
jgi:hypothetical protein